MRKNRKIRLTDNDILGFLKGDDQSIARVLEFTRRIARWEAVRKKFDREEIAEVEQTALLELISELTRGTINNSYHLEQYIKKAVWRISQRQYRRKIREQEIKLNIDDITPILIDESFQFPEFIEKTEESSKKLYKLKKSSDQKQKIKTDLIIVDDVLIQYFKRHPNELYKIHPRRFEELVAAILKDMGYSVELTSHGADGGIDIIATQKSQIGELLIIVDCKRYLPNKRVGVGIVRSLYGIGQQLRASMAMLVTTSFFTKPAKEFQATVKYQLSLKDYNDLLEWLHSYGYGINKI